MSNNIIKKTESYTYYPSPENAKFLNQYRGPGMVHRRKLIIDRALDLFRVMPKEKHTVNLLD